MAAAELISSDPVPISTPGAVASAWHTAVVLFVLVGFSFLGAHLQHPTSHGRSLVYLAVIVMEWVLVAFIWFGLSRRGMRMRDLVGGSWPRPAAFFRDLGIAIAFVLLAGGAVLNGLGYLLKARPPKTMHELFPQTVIEMILWVVMSWTAGFCEEVIFRGYFSRQFAAWTQSAIAGIVLQGMVFGVSHGYQGWKMMALIAFYGMCFGMLARWRGSLRPGMLAHGLQDTAGGLLARFLMH